MDFFELPDMLQKLFSAQVMTRKTFFFEQFFFSNSLSGDTCVISARNEKSFIALHTFVSDYRIFDRYC